MFCTGDFKETKSKMKSNEKEETQQCAICHYRVNKKESTESVGVWTRLSSKVYMELVSEERNVSYVSREGGSVSVLQLCVQRARVLHQGISFKESGLNISIVIEMLFCKDMLSRKPFSYSSKEVLVFSSK